MSSTNRSGPERRDADKHGRARRGRHRSREYRIWGGMCSRCHDPNCRLYYAYGARGIRVCAEWRGAGGFLRFIEHIGLPPAPGLTVERIENDRGYEPGNVRWATRKEQARNTRRTHWVEIDGVRKSLAEWAELTGLHYKRLHWRWRRGHDPAGAIRAALESP